MQDFVLLSLDTVQGCDNAFSGYMCWNKRSDIKAVILKAQIYPEKITIAYDEK